MRNEDLKPKRLVTMGPEELQERIKGWRQARSDFVEIAAKKPAKKRKPSKALTGLLASLTDDEKLALMKDLENEGS